MDCFISCQLTKHSACLVMSRTENVGGGGGVGMVSRW
jgi:hypothetical protein